MSVDEQKPIFICLVCVAPEALSWTAVVIDVGSSIWSIPEAVLRLRSLPTRVTPMFWVGAGHGSD